MSRPTRPASRRGAAAVELALLAPILLLFLVGLWEIGRIVQLQQIVANAAREGGRQAAAGKKTKAQVEDVVLDYLENSGLQVREGGSGNVNVRVVVTNETSDGEVKGKVQPDGTVVPDGAEQGDEVRVAIEYPFANARWLASTFFVSADAKLTAVSQWASAVDRPIVVSTTIPRQPR